jgi:membrane protein implicated in regulation of membrane protease activity
MNESTTESVFGAAAVVAGLGVVTLGLFPLALPIAILLAVAVLPLLPVVIVGGLVAGLITVPVLAVRRLRRRRVRIERAATVGPAQPRAV